MSPMNVAEAGGRALLRFVIVYLIPIALAIFGVVDCLLTPSAYVRALPKSLWLLLIVLLYVVGPLLWIVGGRAEQPQARGRRVPQRRVTDGRPSMLGGFGAAGTHQRRPTVRDSGPGRVHGSTGTGRSVAPDDDPDFLRKLGEQMRKDRPEG
jgi:hypothetical protein